MKSKQLMPHLRKAKSNLYKKYFKKDCDTEKIILENLKTVFIKIGSAHMLLYCLACAFKKYMNNSKIDRNKKNEINKRLEYIYKIGTATDFIFEQMDKLIKEIQ